MPLEFGPECPFNVYFNGEKTEIHLGNGSLLYTVELVKTPTRGTGVSTKLLKDANGATKYIITQERNKSDVYEPPVYFVSAVRPQDGGKVFSAGHGHIGRVYQDGHEICVSFRNKDSFREKASLAPSAEAPDAEDGADQQDTEHHLVPTKSGTSTIEEHHHETAEATSSAAPETAGSRVLRWFSDLFGMNKRHDRFVALAYDGRGKWIYQASQLPNNSGSDTHVPEKDVIIAHKEAEDAKKGFLGLKAVTMEEGNVWLRDLVVATWVTVLWEEERWGRLPASLRVKGLEYLGGFSGGNGAPVAAGQAAVGAA